MRMTLLEIFAGINFRDFLAKYREILNFLPQNFLPFRVMEVWWVAVKSIFFFILKIQEDWTNGGTANKLKIVFWLFTCF